MKLRTVIQAIDSIDEDIENMNLGSARKQIKLLKEKLKNEGVEVTQNVKPEYPIYGDFGGITTENWEQ
jgi:hypothetical protein